MIIFECHICGAKMTEPSCKDHLRKEHLIKKFKTDWASKYFGWREL